MQLASRFAHHSPSLRSSSRLTDDQIRAVAEEKAEYVIAADMPKDELARVIEQLEKQMKAAAAELEFEKAAALRDQVFELRQALQDEDVPEWERMRLADRERRLKHG